jgi:hypothetical protein
MTFENSAARILAFTVSCSGCGLGSPAAPQSPATCTIVAPTRVDQASGKRVAGDLGIIVASAPVKGGFAVEELNAVHASFAELQDRDAVCHMLLQAQGCLERDGKPEAAKDIRSLLGTKCRNAETREPLARSTLNTEPTVSEQDAAKPSTFNSVMIGLHTETDDKDDGDAVTVSLWHNAAQVSSSGPLGRGETWGDQEDRNGGAWRQVELKLAKPLPFSAANDLQLRVEKTGTDGWHFKCRADIGTARVLAETAVLRLGDDDGSSIGLNF